MELLVMLFSLCWSIYSICGLNCTGKMDVVIAMPGSPQQVPDEDFMFLEEGLMRLVNYFTVSPDLTTVEIILYGNNTVTIRPDYPYLYQSDVNTVTSLLSERQLYPSINGGQNVPKAIDAITELHNKNSRPGVPKVGIIFTFGREDLSGSSDEEVEKNVLDASVRAKDAGIEMFVLASHGEVPGFLAITSGHQCRFMWNEKFEDLKYTVRYIGSSICEVLHPPADERYCYQDLLPESSLPPHDQCPTPEVDAIPDSTNCAYFYNCRGNEQTRIKCPDGTLYEPAYKKCGRKEYVSCWRAYCQYPSGLIPHPKYCNKFINCDAGVARVQTCPEGLAFDWHRFCNYPEYVECYGKPIAP